MAKTNTDDFMSAKTMPAAKPDPNERVKIKIARDKNNAADVFVGVHSGNLHYTATIQRGIEVEIPRFAAEVLQNSMQQDEITLAFIQQAVSESRFA